MLKNTKKLLPYFTDVYKCANINFSSIPKNISNCDFLEYLDNTQADCIDQNIKTIFLAISQDDVRLVETAVQRGFTFHFVQQEALFLYKKLRPNHIPNYASHHIGAGGAVLSQDLQSILVVKGNLSVL
jgi:hypothetical protein